MLAETHVIRYDIQHLPKTQLAQMLAETLVRRGAAKLLIHLAVIDDIISVHAVRGRLQVW